MNLPTLDDITERFFETLATAVAAFALTSPGWLFALLYWSNHHV